MCDPCFLTSHSLPNPAQLRAVLQTPQRWPESVTNNLHVSQDSKHLGPPLTATHPLLRTLLPLSSWNPHQLGFPALPWLLPLGEPNRTLGSTAALFLGNLNHTHLEAKDSQMETLTIPTTRVHSSYHLPGSKELF